VGFVLNTMQPHEPRPYRRTLFDRHGSAAADLVRSATYGVMVSGLVFGAVALASAHMSVGVVFIALLAGFATAVATYSLSAAVGGFAKSLTVSGVSAPSEAQYSFQQALVMQGNIDDAIASFDAIIAADATAVRPRVLAAELYAQHRGDARRAAELLREAQRSPAITTGEDVYVTNRLVDLLIGPLGDTGRACVELRKLIERYPASAVAARAREALARLKPTLHAK
jgi:hypothetical protein